MPKQTVLVDLNIIIDVIQHREPFYEDSAAILDAVARKEVNGLLAAHSITTLAYVISRLQNRSIAMVAIERLLLAFTVAAVTDKVIRQALSWNWADFEDAVQMAAAVQANADYIITRNRKDFMAGPLPTLQPGEFLVL